MITTWAHQPGPLADTGDVESPVELRGQVLVVKQIRGNAYEIK